jgi:16S rRNA (guanine966-N2)-methyltransferase
MSKMRIIGGKYKSRIIKTVKSLETRPVMDRIKESIFNTLVHKYSIDNTNVLDLFAGSGSLGLEALSQGAKKVIFVEKSLESYKFLLINIESLNCKEYCSVHKMNVEDFLDITTEKFDLVFCDPPFKMENILNILNKIYDKKILKDNAILVFRSSTKHLFKECKFKILQEKIFGRNIVYFLQ